MSEDTVQQDIAEPLQTEPVDLSPEVETSSEDDLDDILSSIENEVIEPVDKPEADNAESTEEEPEAKEEPEVEEVVEDEVQKEESTGEEPKEQPESQEEEKKFNDEMARRRIAEKQLRQEREDRDQEKLDNYLKDAEDDEVELLKRQSEVERFNLQKERSGLVEERLAMSLDRAKSDIGLLKDGTDLEKQALMSALDDFERMYIVKDKQGRVVEARADVYQYLTERAETIRQLTQVGATQQAQQKQTQSKKALAAPSRSSPTKKIDPDLAAFDAALNEYSD